MIERHCIVFTGRQSVELRAERIELPAGELLVEVTRSLISTGTEMTVFNRSFDPGTHWDQWVSYPFHAGYLAAGRIAAVGAGLEGFEVGQRLAMRAPHASHVTLPPHHAVRIPEGVSDDAACWMGLAKITQVGVRQARHVLGDNVVVIGLGLLGQLVTQYARLSGADQVIAIDPAEPRLAMARAHGATAALATSAAEAADEVKRLTGGRGADVVYDVTGHPAVLAGALKLARSEGTVVLLGDAGAPAQQSISGDLITRGLRVVGAHDMLPPAAPVPGIRWSAVEMHELFMRYLERGQMRVEDLITHRFKPADAAEAYALLNRERQSAMGVLFEWR